MNFNRSITNVLSTGLDIYNCLLILFIILSLLSSKKNKTTRYFMFCAIGVLIFTIADISNWICEGTTPSWHVPCLHILTFVYYGILPFLFSLYLKYVEEYLKPNKINRHAIKVNYIASCLYLIGLIITPFTGFYYSITPDNYYVRGDYNFVSSIFFAIFYICSIYIIVANRKFFSRREAFSFLSFPFLSFHQFWN